MLTYPHINPIAVSIGPVFGIGPLRVHWYGIMYLIGFVAAWWLARYRARQPGSTWTRARHRRSDFLLRHGRHPRRPHRLVHFLRPRRDCRELAERLSHLGRRHVVPRRHARACWPRAACSRASSTRASPMSWISSRRCPASGCWPGGSAISSMASCGASPPICPGVSACRTPGRADRRAASLAALRGDVSRDWCCS